MSDKKKKGVEETNFLSPDRRYSDEKPDAAYL